MSSFSLARRGDLPPRVVVPSTAGGATRLIGSTIGFGGPEALDATAGAPSAQ
jgi:hypothetical protein